MTLWAHADLDRREAARAQAQPWPIPRQSWRSSSVPWGFVTASDMMWLASIQYYGKQRNVEIWPLRLLVPFLERVVALDPLFEYAYRFGGVAAVGPSERNVDAANRLLQRGHQARPDVWKIPYIRASNCLQHTGDQPAWPKGSRQRRRCLKVPSGWAPRKSSP